jgi:hypothetical protein
MQNTDLFSMDYCINMAMPQISELVDFVLFYLLNFKKIADEPLCMGT